MLSDQPNQSKHPGSSVSKTSKSESKSPEVKNESENNAKTISKSSTDDSSSKSSHLEKKNLTHL